MYLEVIKEIETTGMTEETETIEVEIREGKELDMLKLDILDFSLILGKKKIYKHITLLD